MTATAPQPYAIELPDCAVQAADVGGKAVGLARLIGFGFEVPPGFAVTTTAYRESVAGAGISQRISRLLVDDSHGTEATSERIRALFSPRMIKDDAASAIVSAYRRLCAGRGDVPVAVRSSATAEDLAEASFAGQQDTYLWVEGAEAVLRRVAECWASLYTARAIEYRRRLGDIADLAMGVVVQEMVDARAAGVLMTLDPASGDRTAIYLESSHGLGESVVRGEVGPDRFTIDRETLAIRASETGHKPTMWKPAPGRGESIRVDVPAQLVDAASLSDREAVALADIGRRIETAFGVPMDIEWAIDSRGGAFIVQARPETVWSASDSTPDNPDGVDGWDPLDSRSDPGLHWTTSNLGEACPGVLTPLGWSVWAPVVEGSAREAAFAIGALDKSERLVPDVDTERYIRIFKGRAAMQLEFMAMLGDRMPGTTGEQSISGLFGHVPAGMTFRPTRRRYPVVAWRLPYSFLTVPQRARRLAATTNIWWGQRISELPTASLERSLEIFTEARGRLRTAVDIQSILNLASIQPMWDALRAVVARAGTGDVAILSGYGGPEMDVVNDISRVAHGQMAMRSFLSRHGFHGPLEGELSSAVWREDPGPVLRLLDSYRAKALVDPRVQLAAKAEELATMQRRVVAALPRRSRGAALPLLRLAARRLPQRGVPKRAFLQSLDVVRAAARRAGEHLADAGILDDPQDVFYLTDGELLDIGRQGDVRRRIAGRRRRRAEHALRSYPSEWTGCPEPIMAHADAEGAQVIDGLGVSSGVVEGDVRVVLDPANADVRPGDILVARTTDPSWCSLMFVSSALIVDIGGALSHAAVVARELAIPCVVNTRTGTRSLQTGDRVRVDGALGTVEVLARAADARTPEAEVVR